MSQPGRRTGRFVRDVPHSDGSGDQADRLRTHAMRTTAIAPGPQRGNALIEFSLTAVVLFLLSCGVADFSTLVILNRMADGAAAAGTRYGALTAAHYGDLTGMQNAALADTGNYPDASAV